MTDSPKLKLAFAAASGPKSNSSPASPSVGEALASVERVGRAVDAITRTTTARVADILSRFGGDH